MLFENATAGTKVAAVDTMAHSDSFKHQDAGDYTNIVSAATHTEKATPTPTNKDPKPSSARPVLHHLNADSSWLLQLPFPSSQAPQHTTHTRSQQQRQHHHSRDREQPTKTYFNILLDPWLSGSQSDVASWFSTQWHADDSKYASISAVEDLIRRSERKVSLPEDEDEDEDDDDADEFVDARARQPLEQEWPDEYPKRAEGEGEGTWNGSPIDAVIVSHEFTDHCHRQTLLQVDPRVPVFAADKAARIIRGWSHFEEVVVIPPFGGGDAAMSAEVDEEEESEDQPDEPSNINPPHPLLPPWLTITRLQNPTDALYYHSAVAMTFTTTSPSSPAPTPTERKRKPEAILYTPHGIHPSALTPLTCTPTRILALLHGLHDISLGTSISLNPLHYLPTLNPFTPTQPQTQQEPLTHNLTQLNLGAHNGLSVQQSTRAKYWIGTHDEVKTARGLVGVWLLRRRVFEMVAPGTGRSTGDRVARVVEGVKGLVDGVVDVATGGGCDLGGGCVYLEVRNGGAVVLV